MGNTIDDRLWTVAEVADRYGLTSGTLRNWRYRGIGPRWIKIGRQPRYPESELARWEHDGVTTIRRTPRRAPASRRTTPTGRR